MWRRCSGSHSDWKAKNDKCESGPCEIGNFGSSASKVARLLYTVTFCGSEASLEDLVGTGAWGCRSRRVKPCLGTERKAVSCEGHGAAALLGEKGPPKTASERSPIRQCVVELKPISNFPLGSHSHFSPCARLLSGLVAQLGLLPACLPVTTSLLHSGHEPATALFARCSDRLAPFLPTIGLPSALRSERPPRTPPIRSKSLQPSLGTFATFPVGHTQARTQFDFSTVLCIASS